MSSVDSLNPDQDLQNLDPNCLTLIVFLKEFSEKVDVEIKSTDTKKSMNYCPACKELNEL